MDAKGIVRVGSQYGVKSAGNAMQDQETDESDDKWTRAKENEVFTGCRSTAFLGGL